MKFNRFFYITFFFLCISTSNYSMDPSGSGRFPTDDEIEEVLDNRERATFTLSDLDRQKADEEGQKAYLTEIARLRKGNTNEYVKEAALNSKHKAQIKAAQEKEYYEQMIKNNGPSLAAQVKAETEMAFQKNKYALKNIPTIAGGSTAEGVSVGIGSLAKHVTVKGADKLYHVVWPDHEEEFNKKMKLLEYRSLEVSPNLEMLKELKQTLGLLPSEEKKLLDAQLDEIEELILSPEYYEHQSEKVALNKLHKIGELNQRIPLLNELAEQFTNAPENSSEQRECLTTLQSFVRGMTTDFHGILTDDPIEDASSSTIKAHARDGVIFAGGVAATIGVGYLLGAQLPPAA